MTKEDFMEQYGDVLVKFASYYKYTFTFTGKIDDDGNFIVVNVGGCHNDIYRMSVNAGAETTVSSLYPYVGTVYDQSGIELGGFCD